MDIIAREKLLLNTFGWWQFSVCLFAFSALMAIWWHLGRKESDKGQVWLAVSVLCWSLSGLVEVYYSYLLESSNSVDNIKSDMGSLKSILSLCNSFFILMALPIIVSQQRTNWRSTAYVNCVRICNPWFIICTGGRHSIIRILHNHLMVLLWFPIMGLLIRNIRKSRLNI